MAMNFSNFDEILAFINPYGRFQRIVVTMLSFSCGVTFNQVLIMVFVAAEPKWKCKMNSTVCLSNVTLNDKERCKIPRGEWEFIEPINTSIISQFDLVCEKKLLAYLATSCLFFGWAIGVVVFGTATDRFGRKITMPLLFCLLIVAFISSFSPNVYFFIACRFIVGFLQAAVNPLSMIFIGEFTDTKNRSKAMAALGVSYTAGIVLVGIKGYLMRNWSYLMMINTLPYIFIAFFIKFIPESPRWLYVRGLENELQNVLIKITYWNKIELPDSFTISLPDRESPETKTNLLDVFREKKLAIRTLILGWGWFTTLLLFFGISLAAGEITGSVYRDFIIINVAVFPCYILFHFSTNKFGRKMTTAVTMLLVSIGMLCIAFIANTGTLKIIRLTVAVVANISINITYNSLCLWSVELYPTNLRGNATGIVSLMGRIGGVASPWVAQSLVVIDIKAPFIAMGLLGLFSSFSLFLLPETIKTEIQDIINHETNNVHHNHNDESRNGSFENSSDFRNENVVMPDINYKSNIGFSNEGYGIENINYENDNNHGSESGKI